MIACPEKAQRWENFEPSGVIDIVDAYLNSDSHAFAFPAFRGITPGLATGTETLALSRTSKITSSSKVMTSVGFRTLANAIAWKPLTLACAYSISTRASSQMLVWIHIYLVVLIKRFLASEVGQLTFWELGVL